MNSVDIYVLWAKYYNPTLDVYVEKPLGYYLTESHARKMCEALNGIKNGTTYSVELVVAHE